MKRKPNCAIRFRTGVPDYETTFGSDPIRYDWMETVYGTPPEEVDEKAPMPKGKMGRSGPVRTESIDDGGLLGQLLRTPTQ